MKAFFFGPTSAQLLGVYHAPDMSCDRFQGVVMCYPFGQEYMRAHRAFRQLATVLSQKGYHVLRFDYRGTGDSGGELHELTAADWLDDIDCAVQELKDMAGVHSVSLVGLRLGALLAAAAGKLRQDVSSLVMWDPIVKGEDFAQQIKDRIRQASPGRQRANFVGNDGTLFFNGFYLPGRFQQSLEALSLLELEPSARRSLQVASHQKESFAALSECWSAFEGFQHRHVPCEHDWNYVDHVGGILLPQPILKEIADWL